MWEEKAYNGYSWPYTLAIMINDETSQSKVLMLQPKQWLRQGLTLPGPEVFVLLTMVMEDDPVAGF